MRSAVVFLGRTSFHRWKPGELREYRAVCSIHLGDMIRHQCGMVGVRVGEAANPGPSGSVDEELLDGLRHDLTREVPRRVRRRVMDSDSDALLVQADSDADQNPQVSALTPFEGCGRRDVIDDASTEASLGLQSHRARVLCGVTPNWFHSSIQWNGEDGDGTSVCDSVPLVQSRTPH